MKIIITENAGFCFGVERATKIAFDASKELEGEIYTLGPIIHNPQVVENLEKEGVKAKKSLDEIDCGTVIVRSHGVTADVLKAAQDKNLKTLDATCPFVKKAQKTVEKLSQEGYVVLIVGDARHPEVQGIVSYASGEVYVAGTAAEVEKIPQVVKLGIVAQTTQSQDNFNQIVEACMGKADEIKTCNTICDATEVRQSESISLAKKVDCMIVIGGLNSANTKRLTSLCLEIQPNTHHIESSADIDPSWFDGVEVVGITAGASTPSFVIDDIKSYVEGLKS